MTNFVNKSMGIGNHRGSKNKLPPQHIRLWSSPGSLSANNGLLDQRLALKWVQKHIHGFRGDAKMVTIGGNSTGSFSTEAHLNAVPESEAKGLFNRAIMQSGTLNGSGPQPRSWGIDLSEKIPKNLGEDVEKEGWEEVPKASPAQDFVAAMEKDGFDFSPYTDDEGFFTRGWEGGCWSTGMV